ncbi:branched-chain amino acid aminotransferase, putative [Entamoeba histolytica HM-1:IMSS-B]|uniref:Branched-chain amino acid aminotransferase, putative n=6 Tax=Entamoeba histolytica TaxID=5759 RepID=C4LSR8_ENTH1|nr:branched-chain amino acid aminotransferase, putative [Entamoeba histolytica HM-1:IMSS]EMD49292.1 branched-chain amino acid aminotransferase, putative [Entamoeba histolytica KU27]EMH78137.1 branched-chain amino acid aminotransferase, putative [Entamoeba histolytica HM-1:IMSS-B]EMS10799.1 branched-chain amino acid aminotransferase, putative [Entamoeba histolytica HM-3:IMSS]ENY61566.1 branched-chain amino acid aminotransferase, putative [Entamoeba histolytica HM-1:IMSS-A]GAT91483.1 branched-ch|eukprot:XP_656980.1 branched-chain amino acid aminotransferase, putative [Entamoeba histolytica HM-1:IMSS]
MTNTGKTSMATPECIIGESVIFNYKLVSSYSKEIGLCFQVTDEPHVYEVVRIINSKVLFFEDHLSRLLYSIEQLPKTSQNNISSELLYDSTYKLIKALHLINGNIRIVVSPTLMLIHEKEHHYPDIETIKKGVILGEVDIMRDNPNVKSMREDYINNVKKAHEQVFFGSKVFEVVLVNQNHQYTEGSRSNIFFINSNELRTAPDSMVLKGITRKYVIQAAESIGLVINQTCITQQELPHYKAFLSGTSLNILPIYSIGNIQLDSANDQTIQKLLKAYLSIVQDYLSRH